MRKFVSCFDMVFCIAKDIMKICAAQKRGREELQMKILNAPVANKSNVASTRQCCNGKGVK